MVGIDWINMMIDMFVLPVIFLMVSIRLVRVSNAYSPHTCHWALILLSLLVVLMIPVSFILPALNVEILPDGFPSEWDLGSYYVSNDLNQWVVIYSVGVYLFIMLFLLSNHIYDIVQALKVTSRSSRLTRAKLSVIGTLVGDISGIDVRVSTQISTPVTWGFRLPVILLPETWVDWSPSRLQRVMLHELSHIRRKDWLTKSILLVLRSVFWYLIPLWSVVNRALEYSEYACDDTVISKTNSRAEYATDLLDLSGRDEILGAFISLGSCSVANRIQMILEGGRDRSLPGDMLKAGILASALLLLIPFYAISIVANNGSISTYEHRSVDFPFEIITFEETIRKQGVENSVNNAVLLNYIENEYVFPSGILPEFLRDRSGNEYESLGGGDMELVDSIEFKTRVKLSPQPVNVPSAGYTVSNFVIPSYPESERLRGNEEKVHVFFDINKAGQPENIRFIDKSVSRAFKRAVVTALEESQFVPPKINGEFVRKTNIEEVFSFRLDQGD